MLGFSKVSRGQTPPKNDEPLIEGMVGFTDPSLPLQSVRKLLMGLSGFPGRLGRDEDGMLVVAKRDLSTSCSEPFGWIFSVSVCWARNQLDLEDSRLRPSLPLIYFIKRTPLS
jgi:hypothetical protein